MTGQKSLAAKSAKGKPAKNAKQALSGRAPVSRSPLSSPWRQTASDTCQLGNLLLEFDQAVRSGSGVVARKHWPGMAPALTSGSQELTREL
jgi:hypothetical protein